MSANPQASEWKSVDEAREAIMRAVAPIDEAREEPVANALTRVLAEDVIAPFNVPGHNNSAMDGFACRAADVCGGRAATLRVVGASFAGHPFAGKIADGECVKIMTGGKLPEGAQAVVPQEEAEEAGEGKTRINANAARRAGAHIRLAGEDLQAGAVALARGQLCLPAHIGLLASLGLQTARVYRPLRVAFFSTGDEVRAGGEALGGGDVYDSNRHTLRAMLQRMAFEAIDVGIVPDDKTRLRKALQTAAAADAIITSGGASVGEADHIRAVLNECGEAKFWKVAMRPGRPLTYGKVGNADFFGLPGNPVSVMVCFYQFVQAALWKRAGRVGASAAPLFFAKAAAPLRKARGRVEYQRGILSASANGEWQVSPTGDQGSGILSSMARANCFIVLPAECEGVAAGEQTQVQLFEGLV